MLHLHDTACSNLRIVSPQLCGSNPYPCRSLAYRTPVAYHAPAPMSTPGKKFFRTGSPDVKSFKPFKVRAFGAGPAFHHTRAQFPAIVLEADKLHHAARGALPGFVMGRSGVVPDGAPAGTACRSPARDALHSPAGHNKTALRDAQGCFAILPAGTGPFLQKTRRRHIAACGKPGSAHHTDFASLPRPGRSGGGAGHDPPPGPSRCSFGPGAPVWVRLRDISLMRPAKAVCVSGMTHGRAYRSTKALSRARPGPALFSGWNWVPRMFLCQTAAHRLWPP